MSLFAWLNYVQSRADGRPSDPNWLALPTLSAGGGGQIKAAGVAYHRDTLRWAIARHDSLVMAQLVIQANDAYEGAVRVMVGGSELGSIPSRLAGKFRDAIMQLDSVGCPATCRAQLEAELPEGHVDVFLWAAPSVRDHDEPFLPPGLGPPLRLYPGEAERLDASIDSCAKVKRVVKTGEIRPSDGGWCVVVDGCRSEPFVATPITDCAK